MDPATLRGLVELGQHVDDIDDSYQDFGAGQFICRLGCTGIEGYAAASDVQEGRAELGVPSPGEKFSRDLAPSR